VHPKKTRYGTPEDCITGILENSEQLQAIIKKDWKKLEQLKGEIVPRRGMTIICTLVFKSTA
jgi:hypothetical protein